MKRISLLLVSGLFAASSAVPVWAAEEGYGGSAMESGKMEKMEKGKMKHEKMMGWHKMTGTADKIDHEKGMLTFKSSAPDMMLHFPPASLKDLKDGDTITVDLGFAKGEGMKK